VGLPPERTALLKASPCKVVTSIPSGIRAVIGAAHMQFMMPRQVAQKIVPLPVTYGLGRQEDRNFDEKVDQAGYLHLSTLEAYVWHMGNLPDRKTLEEVQAMGLPEMLAAPVRRKSPLRRSWVLRVLRRLARMRLLRGVLYRMYNFLFELYAQ